MYIEQLGWTPPNGSQTAPGRKSQLNVITGKIRVLLPGEKGYDKHTCLYADIPDWISIYARFQLNTDKTHWYYYDKWHLQSDKKHIVLIPERLREQFLIKWVINKLENAAR